MTEIDALLEYWFGEPEPDGGVSPDRWSLWFAKNDATDAEIRDRFGGLHGELSGGGLGSWLESLDGRLATVVLADQMSRNLYRSMPRAFALDRFALEIATRMIADGDDQQLPPIRRAFVYLPFEHAESLPLQERSVALFRNLAESVSGRARKSFDDMFDYAVRHRDIVARFGRFPHRNAILGRDSTPQEAEFLTRPGSSF